MSYVEKNLLPSERIIFRTHLHWIEYVAKTILFMFPGLILCSPLIREHLWVYILIVALFGLIGFSVAWINVATSEFAITNNRVLAKVGVIHHHSLEIMLHQVEGIGVDQEIIGRILGFGTIIIYGTGATKEPFVRINNPLEFRRQVQVLTSA
jgi:uncharacterized membrane protein YdbT with pleckstrin-like domain